MPTYSYSCSDCQYEYDAYVGKIGEMHPCRSCGSAKVEKIWAITRRNGYMVFPYITKHITGSPIEIRDAAHLKQLELEHNVRLRDDAAYAVPNEYLGYNRATKKHEYKEGSGAGMPGCWV